jgi:hypothetical protein
MNREVQLERPPGDPAVDRVVDQLEHGVDRGSIVGEQGRRQARIDSLPDDAADRHALSRVYWSTRANAAV